MSNEVKALQVLEPAQMSAPLQDREPAEMLANIEKLMLDMAEKLNATNDRVRELERQLLFMTPLTPAQERAIGLQVKQRAEQLRDQYRLPESAITAIANAIRKDIKLAGGVRSIRELPRVEYAVYIERIALWDDYSTMRAIRKGVRA